MLIGKGASADLLNNAKCTALYVAVSQGFIEVVRTLCELNCDVNLPVSFGFCGIGGGCWVFFFCFFFQVGRCFFMFYIIRCFVEFEGRSLKMHYCALHGGSIPLTSVV